MARATVLTSEQWFLLSGTENTDGGLIINLNEMQKIPGLYQSKETSTCTIYFFKQFTNVSKLSVNVEGPQIHVPTRHRHAIFSAL
jgi:hypothetical protein